MIFRVYRTLMMHSASLVFSQRKKMTMVIVGIGVGICIGGFIFTPALLNLR